MQTRTGKEVSPRQVPGRMTYEGKARRQAQARQAEEEGTKKTSEMRDKHDVELQALRFKVVVEY